MNKKEAGEAFDKYVVRPFMIVALLTALVKIQSCNLSLKEQAHNQAIETVQGNVKKYDLPNVHLLVPLNQVGSEYSGVSGYFKPDEHDGGMAIFAWKSSNNQTIHVSRVPFESAKVNENNENQAGVRFIIDPEKFIVNKNDSFVPVEEDIEGYIRESTVFSVPPGEAELFLEMQRQARPFWKKLISP